MIESARYPSTRWLILLSAVFAYISLQIANLSIAPLFPIVGRDLGLGPAQLASLMSVYTFSGCVLMFWVGGAIVDHFGLLTGILLGLLSAGLPMTFMPLFGHSYHAMIWIRIVEGLAAGFAFPAEGIIIASWFGPHQKGLAGGLMSASITLGVQFGVYGGSIPVEKFGVSWQTASAYLSIFAWIGVVFTVILIVCRPKAPAAAKATSGTTDKGLFKRCLFTPLTFFGIMTVFMVSWVYHSLTGMVPGALASPRPLGAGYTAVQSSSLMLGVTIAGVLGPVLGGILLDKIFNGNPKFNLLAGFVAMFTFIGLMAFPVVLHSPSFMVVCLVMAALGFQFVFPTLYIYASRVYPLRVVGQMVGLWIGLGTFGGVIGQAVSGAVAQGTGTYLWLYILMAVAAFIGFFVTFLLVKQKPVAINPEVAERSSTGQADLMKQVCNDAS
jgi:MFS family permease